MFEPIDLEIPKHIPVIAYDVIWMTAQTWHVSG